MSALFRLNRGTFCLRGSFKGNLGSADSTMEGKMMEETLKDGKRTLWIREQRHVEEILPTLGEKWNLLT